VKKVSFWYNPAHPQEPDAVWAVSGHPPGRSRRLGQPPVIDRQRIFAPTYGTAKTAQSVLMRASVLTALPQGAFRFFAAPRASGTDGHFAPHNIYNDRARPARIFFLQLQLYCRVPVLRGTLHVRSISERQRVGQTHPASSFHHGQEG